MKIKYIFILLLSALMICFSACEDNDSTDVIDKDKIEINKIETDQTDIVLKVDETKSVKILEGGNNYHIFSLNEEVALVTQLEDSSQFEIKGLKYGITQILITDAHSNVKTMPILVADYEVIKSDSEEVIEIEGSFGKVFEVEINILEANGKVGIELSNNSSLSNVKFEENKFTAKVSLKEVETIVVTFTDECDLKHKVSISIKNIDYKPPYTDEQYAALLENASIRYYSELNEDTQYVSGKDGSRINETNGDIHTYGWKYTYIPYWGDPTEVSKKISFKGDKTVGLKTEGKIAIKGQWGDNDTYDLKHVEIMKVEDGKIWCLFSYTNSWGGYTYGYFVDTINP